MPETYRKWFRGVSLVSRRRFTASSRAKSPQPGHQAMSIPFFHMSDYLQVMQLPLDVCGGQGPPIVVQDRVPDALSCLTRNQLCELSGRIAFDGDDQPGAFHLGEQSLRPQGPDFVEMDEPEVRRVVQYELFKRSKARAPSDQQGWTVAQDDWFFHVAQQVLLSVKAFGHHALPVVQVFGQMSGLVMFVAVDDHRPVALQRDETWRHAGWRQCVPWY